MVARFLATPKYKDRRGNKEDIVHRGVLHWTHWTAVNINKCLALLGTVHICEHAPAQNRSSDRRGRGERRARCERIVT